MARYLSESTEKAILDSLVARRLSLLDLMAANVMARRIVADVCEKLGVTDYAVRVVAFRHAGRFVRNFRGSEDRRSKAAERRVHKEAQKAAK